MGSTGGICGWLAPDPFAAELVAEAVAQAGVLFLRLAGEQAGARGDSALALDGATLTNVSAQDLVGCPALLPTDVTCELETSTFHDYLAGPDLAMTSLGLTSAGLAGLNWSGANLTSTVFLSADLTGMNFTGANLTGVDFGSAKVDGVIWLGATCSDGVVATLADDCCAHLSGTPASGCP
ncbi:MAG: hypothetical protein ACI9WU_001281 [Myxococcota bacterium]